MALPAKPDLDYSYSAYQQSQGDNSFPGTFLDNDLANLKTAIDETIDFTAAVIRSDGKLQNGVVDKASLDASILLGVAPPRPWLTATGYAVDQTATINNSIYICTAAHVSGVFASDLGAGYWGLIAELTVPAAIADGTVTEPKHAADGVSTRALADGSVTTAKLADGAATAVKLAPAIVRALTPVGLESDYAGFAPPPGWLFEFGQAVSRVTYLDLFNAICPGVTATAVSGSPTLTNVSVDLRHLGLEGAAITGANIPSGTTVVSVTATTIVMSLNASGSAVGVAARIFPHGLGDGSTTFNLPDARDRSSVGRGNMGGVAANRITASGAGNPGLGTSRLGAAGGVDRHAITVAQMPSHGHTATSNVFDPGHTHTHATYNDGLASAAPGIVVQGVETSGPTGSSLTGITVGTTVAANGGGEAHPNLPPTRVTNKIIFTGVL